MQEVKKNLTSWQYWLSAAFAFAVLSLIVFPLLILPIVAWVKNKVTSATALMVGALLLSFSAANAAPVTDLEITKTYEQSVVRNLQPMFATAGNGEMILALTLGGLCALAVFFFTSKRLPRCCAGLTGGAFVFGVTLFFPIKVAAAQFADSLIARQINIRAQTTSDGSNGLLIVWGPSGTNYRAVLTNGQVVQVRGALRRTNFTGFQIISNVFTGIRESNGWIDGDLVCTNCPGDTAVLQTVLN